MGNICYDPKLIARPKTSHIYFISATFPGLGITTVFGKLVRHKGAWSNKRAQLRERWG
jgi:hypothetical protein